MQPTMARDRLLDRTLSLDSEQFEQLCKMLIERAEQTRELELTPFRGDGGIDVHAIIDRDLFYASLGVQAKQYQPGNTVGVNTLHSFKGALTDQNYHIGTVITTSSFTDGAMESAQRDSIRLIDGDRLLDIMISSEIGVNETSDGEYDLDSEFWKAFDQPEDRNTIPSLEVPQADNFDVIRLVLQAVDAGLDMKPTITGYLERKTGNDWDPRQADYYGIAGWLLGFLHKEQQVEVDGRLVRRWGLTRAGEKSTSRYSTEVTISEHGTGFIKQSVMSRSSPESTSNWSRRMSWSDRRSPPSLKPKRNSAARQSYDGPRRSVNGSQYCLR